MHCTARSNIAHNFMRLKEGSIYSVKDFLVQVNKEEFRVMRYADFMLEFEDDTTIRKASVKSEGFNHRLYLSSTSSTLIIDDEKILVLKKLKTDDRLVPLIWSFPLLKRSGLQKLIMLMYCSGVELTKEMLPAVNTTPKARTLENLLMWARNQKYDSSTFHYEVKIDKVRTKKGWKYPSCGGEKCNKGNITRKAGQFWYRLELEISNDTAKVVVVMFDETTTSLVKCSASLILGSEWQEEHLGLPPTLANIVFIAKDVEGSVSSGMVAAKADFKSPVLGALNADTLVATLSKPSEDKKHKRQSTKGGKSRLLNWREEKQEDCVKRHGVSSVSLAKQGPRGNRASRKPRKQAALSSIGAEVSYHNIGAPSYQCRSCNATMWFEERNNKGNMTANPTFSLCFQKGVDGTIVGSHVKMLDRNSSIAKAFRMARDWCHSHSFVNVKMRLLSERTNSRQYNAPTIAEVTALILNDLCDDEPTRDIVVKQKDSEPKTISELHPSYMALQYPLLFPFEEYGGGRLFQQYLVDAYTVIEEQRLSWTRNNQDTLRVDLYHNNYQDAMALCRPYGNPDLFITFTSNLKWPKINEMLTHVPGQRDHDRPKVGTRVFTLKLTELLDDLTKNQVFRESHTSRIDDIISAELPSPTDDPAGYKAVTDYMLRGPCGKDATYAACNVEGKCSKHFPKPFYEETIIDQDGYPIYRRRENAVTFKKGKFTFDNKYVVSHNRYLLLK
nr:DNA helicase PIF1, ATP-dependent [Tanacetum cinerariifolium]